MTVFRVDETPDVAEAACDPVSQPSARTRRALSSEAEREARRSRNAGLIIAVAVVAMIVLAFALSGCSTVSEQRLHVVREGRILLRFPAVGDPRWEQMRATFLSDAEAVDPPAEVAK